MPRTLYHHGVQREGVRRKSVQREIVFTGIGGQGVQLAARSLAEAAAAEGHRVQLFASYGGMMRGGNSDSFVVISDEAITAPPVVGSAWGAVVMHHEHAEPVWQKLHEGSVAAVNTSVVDPASRPGDPGVALLEVPALDLATELGAPMAASLVLLGAFVARTGIVGAEALLGCADRVLPGYRAAAAGPNREALRAGLSWGAGDRPTGVATT